MPRALALVLALAASACAYRPEPTDQIRIVDSPADVRVCTRLGTVSPPVLTGPTFDDALDSMLGMAVALGATDIHLAKRSHDWAKVVGVAYRCGPGIRVRGRTVVVRAKG